MGLTLDARLWAGLDLGLPRLPVRLTPSIQKTVLFLGHEAPQNEGGIVATGTGFLLEHEGYGYLVTAQHVAMGFGDSPFVMRFNRVAGGSHVFQVDPIVHKIRWASHPDPNVDLAVLPFNWDLRALGLATSFIPSSSIAKESGMPPDAGIGDACYAVGLFRLLVGSKMNLAVVHSGNVALIAGNELVPVHDWHTHPTSGKTRMVHAHLVGMHSLDGLSGAPVFVRPPLVLGDVVAPEGAGRAYVSQESVKLLGVWHGSWRGKSEVVVASGAGDVRPSFGMGVVVPAARLLDIVGGDELTEIRRKHYADIKAATPDAVVSPDSASEKEVEAELVADNPSHKEDFTNLLGAAAKVKTPDA